MRGSQGLACATFTATLKIVPLLHEINKKQLVIFAYYSFTISN